MKCFVFKPKRRKNGKVTAARFYSGRYRLAGDDKPTDVPLQTVDKQVAKARLDRIVQDLEREHEGMIAPKSIRMGAQKPLIEHPSGVFTMTDAAIADCIAALNAVNVKADKAHFDTSLLKEI